MEKKPRLGRGLGALISTEEPTAAVGSTIFNEVPISQIKPNPNQPRKDFDEESLQELAISIKNNGIISPITLRKISDNEYQIVAGERRYRASIIAGLEKIPAYIRDASEEQVMEMALIENIQREDLNAIEIALSYNSLCATLNLTQEALAERIGKKRATITNYLRLLRLPAEIQIGIKNKVIEMGHARAIAGISDAQMQLKIYNEVVKKQASVRQTEEMVRKALNPNENQNTPSFNSEEYTKLQNSLSTLFNSKIKLKYNENGKGSISIPFKNDEDLSRIMSLLDKIK
ncbi:MAG: ParB/RepB/Spo0J family partition protein [Paludibacteraceae bacterium]|nr:ParB/RepB/Spo0J family partition protein [Paludibacteraceae bacterium]